MKSFSRKSYSKKSGPLKPILLLAVLCLLLSGVMGQAQTVNEEKAAQYRTDLAFLANTLPARHPNPFQQLAKPLWQQAVADLDAQLPKLSEPEIITGMARIVAMLGDSHTILNLNQSGLDFHYYPLALTWLRDGYYVTGTVLEHQALLGSKLLQINGRDVTAVERELATLIPHENDSWVKEMVPFYITAAEILEALHIVPQAHAGAFDFQTRDGAVQTVALQPVSLKEDLEWEALPDLQAAARPLSLQNRSRFYWYRYLPESQSIYFQYNSCREMPSLSFAKFNKDFFGFADKHPVGRVIIDLRFNSGGNALLFDPFLNELKKRPGFNQPGRIVVLIGRKTFDAAVTIAVKLHAEANAVFVGEPSGGKPNYFGEDKSFRLPNSGVEITYATKYYSSSKTSPVSLLPDLYVETTPEEYFQGFDPVLTRALQ